MEGIRQRDAGAGYGSANTKLENGQYKFLD